MAIEHDAIPNADIHEPKGVSTATANQIYLADGAGSGAWANLNPFGGAYFTNLSTPYTLAATTAYQKLAATTTTTSVANFTHSGSGRLTYTGTAARHVHMVFDCSFSQASGASRDVTLAWYKNGVLMTGAETVRESSSGNLGVVAMHWDDMAATNDYYEVYIKISANQSVDFSHTYMFLMGMPM